jgi:dTDP-4-dehydrorhamnose 3,5-epimerase
MIHGAQAIPLTQYCDCRGRVFEILRRDDPHFAGFGQAYFSSIYPGVVKAWHAHQRQTDFICIIKGMCRVGLFDNREGSPTRGEIDDMVIGEHNLILLQIPPGVFHGFKTVSPDEVFLVNLPSEPYDRESPDELRRPWNDPGIPFNWDTQFR